MEIKRLIKRVTVPEMDSVKQRKVKSYNNPGPQLLEKCQTIWMGFDEVREQGDRAVRFTYGDQWGDKITVNGVTMTQREYLQGESNIVLQTNQIKAKVDTLVGVMVKEQNEPVCNARDRDEQQYGEVITTALQANCDVNKMESLYIKFMKDLCLRGYAVAKEEWAYRNGLLDSWTDYIEPNCVFFDSEMTDPRFWDITLIGQFFDLTFERLVARFAKSESDYTTLKQIYHSESELLREGSTLPGLNRTNEGMSFLFPEDITKCRVFEVWTLETKARYRLHDTNEGTEEIIDADDAEALREIEAENRKRRSLGRQAGWAKDEVPVIEKEFFIDEFWYCRFLAPDGTILWEGESPYADRQHPFSIVATPFVEGRISGYMNDAIDHNIAMNRAIILQDWLARTQAKGVVVVPKKVVPNGDMKAFANSWTSMDGMMFIEMKPGEEGLMPKVFHGTAQMYPASELINTYSHLLENSTAISSAIQGKSTYSGTSGTLYAQMAANSSTPIAALMSQFHRFLEMMQAKKMKNIIMFYDVERLEKIAGKIDHVFDNLNLAEIAHIEFDLAVKESTATPVYRAVINDEAKEFLMKGIISFEEYLTIADVPYADKLLQMRQARQAEIQDAEEQGMTAPSGGGSYNPNAGQSLAQNPVTAATVTQGV